MKAQQLNTTKEEEKIWSILEQINDPEVPVLSIMDLGIVRNISFQNNSWIISITPTYSGCPAMDMITEMIGMELKANGFNNIIIKQILSPAWTTDWMTQTGKEKLKSYGIAPPNPKQQVCHQELFLPDEAVECPRCHSYHTHRISEFGSTACKALYQCDDCKEPFDYFKCH